MSSHFLIGRRPYAVATPAAPVPVAGADLVQNGSFESWASATDASNWTETVTGGSTFNRDDAVPYAGTYAARMDVDASSNSVVAGQSLTHANGVWLQASAVVKSLTASRSALLRLDGTADIDLTMPLTSTYTRHLMTARAAQANYSVQMWRVLAASFSIWWDNVSVIPLTLSSLISARLYAHADIDISAAVTRTARTQAGFAVRVDSPTNPQNFIISYLDGAGNVVTDKCVGGAYTNIAGASGAVTYADGKIPRVVCSGTSVSVFYDGTQVGTTQTVSDAGIIGNKYHGLFSTYAANTFASIAASSWVAVTP